MAAPAKQQRNTSKLDEYRTKRGWEGVLDADGKITGFHCKNKHWIPCPTLNRPAGIKFETCPQCKDNTTDSSVDIVSKTIAKVAASVGVNIDPTTSSRILNAVGTVLGTVTQAAAAEPVRRASVSFTDVNTASPPPKKRDIIDPLEEIEKSNLNILSVSDDVKGFVLQCKKKHTFIHQFVNNGRRIRCPECLSELAVGILDYLEATDVKHSLDYLMVEFKCFIGHNNSRSVTDIIEGKGCGLCKGSSPIERYIEAYLRERGYTFEREVLLDTPGHKLRCDFVVSRKTGTGKILVEADGAQHFDIGHYCKTEADLKRIQERDLMKQCYVMKMKKWSVIRIDVPANGDLETYVRTHLEAGLRATKGIYFSNKVRYRHLMTETQRAAAANSVDNSLETEGEV